ncbi:MAG: amino acid permease [Halieaceae bacterium]|nr:amino acid permease [Halieaceae bacterium]
MNNRTRFGRPTLIALVIGNTLGAGVFTTSGFAMGDLGSPVYVLLTWVLGGLLALCGALSYGALARLMPVSGGEYYFLSRSIHPLAGFIAGWISLLAGFTGAIALAALTLEAYLVPPAFRHGMPENTVATLTVLLAGLTHGLHARYGAALQNTAVAIKLVLIIGFIIYALFGTNIGAWEGVIAWRSAGPAEFSISAFAMTLMWVSYSYSGFNASTYVSSEAESASRNVPGTMVQGTLIIMLIYLLLNGIFVFAPKPGDIAFAQDVAALAASALAGEMLAGLMRGIIVLALFTSVSAMVMAGPRVYAQMAADGLMPATLKFRGRAPASAIALQAVLAISLVWTTGLRELLSYLGFTLGLSAALTVTSLFIAPGRRQLPRADLPGYPWAPLVFILSTLTFAGLAAIKNPAEMLAAIITILSAVILYLLFGRKHQTINK